MDPSVDYLPKVFDVLQKVVTTFAYVVGASWVLMNYFRNRTHVRRLQLDIKAEIITCDNRRYLLTTIQVKNLGLSIIKLPPPTEDGAGPYGSALMVKRLREDAAETELFEVNWGDVQAFEVLEHHTAIEPGLSINQQKLMRLPDQEYDAWWVRLRVLAHKQSWSAVAIAVPESISGDD